MSATIACQSTRMLTPLGRLIRAAMEDNGWSLRDVQARTGVSRTRLHELLKDDEPFRFISDDAIVGLGVGLGVGETRVRHALAATVGPDDPLMNLVNEVRMSGTAAEIRWFTGEARRLWRDRG